MPRLEKISSFRVSQMPQRGGPRPGAGRPAGQPNKATRDLTALAQQHTETAVSALANVVNDATVLAPRVKAAEALLDRGHGRPTQHIEARISPLEQLSDEELAAGIAALRDGISGKTINRLSMRGGHRAGAGRKAGVANKRTLELRALAEGQPQEGTPLAFLTSVYRNEALPIELRLEAAGKAAPYVHPRLAAVTLGGDPGAPLHAVSRIEIVPVAPRPRDNGP
jgi:hypothetical protein